MAKGLEDTTFYIYNRLSALNEVGGEPQHFGLSVEQFHALNLQRQRDWPATLLATSTHDTKRSEDVRARMLAISEVPQLWRSSLQRWRVINRRWKRSLHEMSAPDPNEEYLFYQTLLGTWPVDLEGRAAAEATPEYIERIQAYMAKALKEAKMNTSWIQPNEQWDSAMSDFVARVLDPSAKNKFLPTFLPVAAGHYLSSLFNLGAGPRPSAFLLRAIFYEPSHVMVMIVAAGIAFFGVQAWDLSRNVTPLRATLAMTVLAWSVVAMSAQSYNPFLYFQF